MQGRRLTLPCALKRRQRSSDIHQSSEHIFAIRYIPELLQCYAKLDDAENALRCMAGVGKHRSLQMHLLVASLQRGLKKHREAVLSYKAALKCNPMALEAVTALAQLGTTWKIINVWKSWQHEKKQKWKTMACII